ncbi:hypothetical protein BH11MYX1_BH11MYX1_33570 [soil metagenome]
MRRVALVVMLGSHVAAADVSLKLDHEPAPRHLQMRRTHVAATPVRSSPPLPPAPAGSPLPRSGLEAKPQSEPAQVRELQQPVSAQVDLGYVVDGTQFSPAAHTPVTNNPAFALSRAYGFGEAYLSTHGVGIESLSSYFAGRFILANKITTVQQSTGTRITAAPPIATWYDRSTFEPRSAWAEAKDFLGDPAFAPLRLRGGEQYVYGPWVMHFYGANAAWEGKLVRATVYGGSQVPDYTIDPHLPTSRAALAGGSVRFDLRDLEAPIPITIGGEAVKLAGENLTASTHSQLEADWRPSKDIALIGQVRALDHKFVNEHAQLRARYHEVTNFVVDFTHRSSTDWIWDPTVLESDPIAAKRYLDLGPVLPQVLVSARAGTLVAENIDLYLRGAWSHDLANDKSRDTYSPSYLEEGGALEVRVRRTLAVGFSALSRQTTRDDRVTAEIMDTPGVPDPIPVNASSQTGERSFTEVGVTARASLGARKFSLLLEVYGRRTRYALDYCVLATGESECRSAIDTGVRTLEFRGGGRAQVDAWIGKRLRLFASYDLSSSLDFEPDITGYKSLKLMMEGIY